MTPHRFCLGRSLMLLCVAGGIAVSQPMRAEDIKERLASKIAEIRTAQQQDQAARVVAQQKAEAALKHRVSKALLEYKIAEIRRQQQLFQAKLQRAGELADEATSRRQLSEAAKSRHYAEVVRFLYYFGKFVEWPARSYLTPNAPHVIGAVKFGEWGEYLGAIEGNTVRGRFTTVRECPDGKNAERVHVLFINTSDAATIRGILEITRNEPVLTVGSGEQFLKSGGIVRLFLDEKERLRIEVNVDAMARNGLKISSGLLNLAKIYREEGAGKNAG